MYIVRYADDFKIFYKTKTEAKNIKSAVTQWLSERLKLQVSEDKTSITNLKMQFLGFKIKLQKKGNKRAVDARMSNKALNKIEAELTDQIKLMQKPENETNLYLKVNKYNAMVEGI